MPHVEANGISLYYEEEGAGDPLLLIMGLGGQLIDWQQDFVDELTGRDFRVIRLDNRDAGLSAEFDWEPPSRRRTLAAMVGKRPLDVGYRLSDMADDAAALLDVLGIDRAHVVGASMGGMISQSLAIAHPDRVLSLTSIMSNTGDRKHGGISKRVMAKLIRMKPPTKATAAEEGTEMYALWAGSSWDRDEHLANARLSIERSYRPKGVERQAATIAAGPDRTEALRAVKAPTLVVHGLQDRLVKPSGGAATARAIPGSRLLMFPDMGHDLPKTRRAEIAGAIAVNAARAV